MQVHWSFSCFVSLRGDTLKKTNKSNQKSQSPRGEKAKSSKKTVKQSKYNKPTLELYDKVKTYAGTLVLGIGCADTG